MALNVVAINSTIANAARTSAKNAPKSAAAWHRSQRRATNNYLVTAFRESRQMRAAITLAAFALFVSSTLSLMQDNTGDKEVTRAAGETIDASSPTMQDSSGMEQMASSMKSMADMCKLMMEREMHDRPLKITAAAIVGSTLTIAALLLICLEVQCIRLLGVRIKLAKKQLRQAEARD